MVRPLQAGFASIRPRRWLAAPPLLAPLLSVLLALAAPGCDPSSPAPDYQGYVEADYTYVAAPLAGRLLDLPVRRGQGVAAGQALFRLEGDQETDALELAERRLQEARDRLANLQKGQRPSELQALEARLGQARASLGLSRLEYQRRQKLLATRAIPQETLDQARTRHEADLARVEELGAQLATARLGAREDEIKAAEAEVGALNAARSQARWNLEQKAQAAPAAALVFDTFFTPGEWVPAGRPVAALLVPERLKLRFFVPEPQISGLQPGQDLGFSCDGCAAGLRAKVSYISPQAEYTPPVIYSTQTRAKLVFMVEASPLDPAGLHPGQPVEVRPGGPAR